VGVTAALFPGQGSQVVGMAREFYDASPAARVVLDEAEGALPGLLEIMWSGPEEILQLTANQQPALVAAGAAAFAGYLEAGGEKPKYAAGHSLGEFTAHVAAGSLTVAEAIRLVRARGAYMQEAVPAGEGAMAAVMKLSPEEIAEVCAAVAGIAEIANLNSPGQTAVSGEKRAVAEAGARLKALGARVIPLKVSAPFHCSLMKPAAERLASDLAAISFGEMTIGIVSNVTAELIESPDEIPTLLKEQVTKPVRWADSLLKLRELGVERFLEFGSGQVLTSLVGRTLAGAEALAITNMKSLGEAL
jgi:[acyl-carrier-protein] S-malonyltransferase